MYGRSCPALKPKHLHCRSSHIVHSQNEALDVRSLVLLNDPPNTGVDLRKLTNEVILQDGVRRSGAVQKVQRTHPKFVLSCLSSLSNNIVAWFLDFLNIEVLPMQRFRILRVSKSSMDKLTTALFSGSRENLLHEPDDNAHDACGIPGQLRVAQAWVHSVDNDGCALEQLCKRAGEENVEHCCVDDGKWSSYPNK